MSPAPPLAGTAQSEAGAQGVDSVGNGTSGTTLSDPRQTRRFGDLVLGDPAIARVQVGNAGRADLVVDDVLVGAPFSLDWTGGPLPAGTVRVVEVGLLPTSEADLEAELTVLSSDPARPSVQVTVRAAPRAPGIQADPPEVVWDDALAGGDEILIISNDGAGPLRIQGVAIAQDGGGVFQLLPGGLPDRLEPGDDAVLDLSALPSDLALGTLRVLSNDPVTPILDVPLQIGAQVQTCPDDLPYAPEPVEIDDTCAFSGLPPVWDPVVEAEWRAFPDHIAHALSYVPPIVGRVTDDDGDGDVDADDPPDIVTVSILEWGGPVYSGVLRVLSADGRRQHWSLASWVDGAGDTWVPSRIGAPALGDIDGDGWPEVVVPVDRGAYRGPPGVLALGHDGTPLWVAPLSHAPAGLRPAVSIADLEGDGSVEVIVGRTILAGDDGRVLGAGEGSIGLPRGPHSNIDDGPKSVPMDLDLDGIMEVVAGNELLAPDGSTVCIADTPDGTVAAADLDGDGLGEVVLVQDGRLAIYEHDCQVTRTWMLPDGGHGGPATLADFDGDGAVEIGVASKYAYYVFESDGSVLWESEIRDGSSHSTGSSVFDLDGDGSSAVVFADEYDLYVMDGATGRPRFLWTGHAAGTAGEYPVIADVDDDGSAEIVLAHSARTDLDVCNLDCDEDRQRLVVRVDNPGAAPLPPGLRFEVWSAVGGAEVVVAQGVVEDEIPPGMSSAGFVVDFDTALMPDRRLTLVVDPDDTVEECDELDNQLVLDVALCPHD